MARSGPDERGIQPENLWIATDAHRWLQLQQPALHTLALHVLSLSARDGLPSA